MLDTQNQILRFTDVALDVQSNAAFGLLGAAAQAAAPLLQKTLADEAVIDLKPFAADAKQRIGAAVGALAAESLGSARTSQWTICGLAASPMTIIRCACWRRLIGTVNVAISSLALQ